MRLTTNLRAAQSRLESLRSAIAQDLTVLEDVFEAVKQIAKDSPTRGVAETGRFYATWLTNELNDNVGELQDLLAEIIKELGDSTK